MNESYTKGQMNENEIFDDDNLEEFQEQACCNNIFTTNIYEEKKNYFLKYLNDLCSNKVPVEEDAQICDDPFLKMKTPLCSKNMLKKKNKKINNETKPKKHNTNNEDNKSELSLNASNDSAAEPIMTSKNFEESTNKEKEKQNFFSLISKLFKNIFTKNEDNLQKSKDTPKMEEEFMSKNENEKNFEKNENSSIKMRSEFTPTPKKNEDCNSKIDNCEEDNIFYDNISVNTSEDNDNNNKELVSHIPSFDSKVNNIIKNNEKKIKCGLCSLKIDFEQKYINLSCSHIFHGKCIDKWIRRKKNCPVCKQKISPDTIKKII